jgi:predicted chitinase
VADAPREVARDLAPPDLPPPAPGCGFAVIVTRQFFDAIFPPAGRHPLYTYDALVQAAKGFPAFAATGDLNTCRKEAAAFLANVNRETGTLHFADQIAKAPYCQPSATCPCDPATTDRSKWYYGRGAIQLSWNYNYCRAGTDLGTDIAANPSLVATNAELSWKTALWFWMVARAGACHTAMTTPDGGGFGQTINAINGGVECDKGGYGAQEGVTARVRSYLDYTRRLGATDVGTAQDNDC